jgi:hypothetical protein
MIGNGVKSHEGVERKSKLLLQLKMFFGIIMAHNLNTIGSVELGIVSPASNG